MSHGKYSYRWDKLRTARAILGAKEPTRSDGRRERPEQKYCGEEHINLVGRGFYRIML